MALSLREFSYWSALPGRIGWPGALSSEKELAHLWRKPTWQYLAETFFFPYLRIVQTFTPSSPTLSWNIYTENTAKICNSDSNKIQDNPHSYKSC